MTINSRTDARKNHSAILRAAEQLFARDGLQTEMRAVAAHAGLGVGTLYRHFPSKDDLVIALLDAALEGARQAADEISEQDDPRAAVMALLELNLQLSDRYDWLFNASVEGRLSQGALEVARAKGKEYGLRGRYERLLARVDSDVDVRVAASLLEGASVPWISRSLLTIADRREIAVRIVDQLLPKKP